jgi:hypothetical protein
LDLGSGSFTVEAWVNPRNLAWEEIFIRLGAYALHIEKTYSYPNWQSCIGSAARRAARPPIRISR